MVSSEDDKTRVLTSAENAPSTDAPRIHGADADATVISAAPAADATVMRAVPEATRIAQTADLAQSEATRIAQPAEQAAPAAPAAARPAADARTIKQRFVLEKVLGSGGMGAVYQAVDLRKQEASDRDPYVAIKLLNEDFQRHPDAFISLQREARKAQTLAHPNIVTVYDFDRDGDTVFMTMECLIGRPLDKLLREHADTGLPRPQALSILRDVGAALIYAHSHRIAHSDFKPGNVFVTDKGVAKVLDFGIARAVSGLGGEAVEQTVFDPGSLGALTPAYASLEMLHGETPDPRDDIYALGCVAYELFAGRHPFDKKTAAQAQTEKLKPARIASLSRRQWRALEQALAFSREQRLASVEQLLAAFDKGRSPWFWLGGAVLLAGAIGGGVVALQPKPVQPDLKQLRAGVETQVKQQLAADNLEGLFKTVAYDNQWAAAFDAALAAYAQLAPADDPLLKRQRDRAAGLYMKQAASLRDRNELENAQTLLAQAARWGADIGAEQQHIEQLLAQRKQAEAAAAAARAQAAAADQARAAQQRELEQQREQAAQAQRELEAAENAARQAFSCRGNVALTPLQERLQALQKLSGERYGALLPEIGKQLAACVGSLMRSNPAGAEQLQRNALALLPGDKSLAAIKLDPCAALAPGSGGRSAQNVCVDKLAGGSRGPRLVVVGAGKAFAIGKYEVSGEEFGAFCAATKACGGKSFSGSQPARGVDHKLAEQYVSWLSEQSGFHYRLPSYQQWLTAARADGAQPDANRNCMVSAKGLNKGGFPVPVTTGKANAWGLVNATGNVREWTADGDAAGGGFNDPIERCVFETRDGGDQLDQTGLRVARDIAAP